jgi:hypothetical protein
MATARDVTNPAAGAGLADGAFTVLDECHRRTLDAIANIALEESCLYPAARARLAPGQQQAMERDMAARRAARGR